MSGDEYPTYGDFCDEEAADEERFALLRRVPAFINDSHYGHWRTNNCKQCKWGVNRIPITQYPCPVQATLHKATIGHGLVRPWIIHVAGISDGGQCKAKENV